MSKKETKKGFTLIELLVVIAIIAILAAILFPMFARAREKSRQTTCASNQRQIAASAQMYTQDHEETLPVTSSFWTALTLDPGVVICPTKGKTTVNGYGFNYNLSGVSVGAVDDPTTEMLTCDATYATTDKGNIIVDYTNIDGIRHSGQFVASYLDGHVAQTTTAPFTVKWNTKTSYVTVTYPAMTSSGTIVGSTIAFSTGGTAWTVGANSIAVIPAGCDGCVQFTPNLATGNFMIGFAETFTPSSTSNYTGIKYATYANCGTAKIYENGTAVTLNVLSTTYTSSSVITIERTGKDVTYWVGSTKYYTSLVPSTGNLMIVAASDCSSTGANGVSYYRYAKL